MVIQAHGVRHQEEEATHNKTAILLEPPPPAKGAIRTEFMGEALRAVERSIAALTRALSYSGDMPHKVEAKIHQALALEYDHLNDLLKDIYTAMGIKTPPAPAKGRRPLTKQEEAGLTDLRDNYEVITYEPKSSFHVRFGSGEKRLWAEISPSGALLEGWATNKPPVPPNRSPIVLDAPVPPRKMRPLTKEEEEGVADLRENYEVITYEPDSSFHIRFGSGPKRLWAEVSPSGALLEGWATNKPPVPPGKGANNSPHSLGSAPPVALSAAEKAIPGYAEDLESCALQVKGKKGVDNPYSVCRSSLMSKHGLD